MSLFKRGNFWCFDFWFRKHRYQGSTRIKNHEKARLWLNAYRTNLALYGVGLIQKEPPLRLDQVNELAVSGYVGFRRLRPKVPKVNAPADKAIGIRPTVPAASMSAFAPLAVSTINGELRTLRKALIFASRLKLCERPTVSQLPGEKNRTFVLTGELEKLYLSVAPYPLKQVAILMLDLGLRPEEATSLRKTAAGVRRLACNHRNANGGDGIFPQTGRTLEVFELCFALFPDSEWVFPGNQGKHLHPKSVTNIHTKLRDKHGFPSEFVLYSLRHSMATRLAQSGANVFELKTALGHSSIKVSERYIHPDANDISLAFKRKELLDRLMRGEEVKHEQPPNPESVDRSK